eukprot:2769628-Amphidinium_carterae.1
MNVAAVDAGGRCVGYLAPLHYFLGDDLKGAPSTVGERMVQVVDGVTCDAEVLRVPEPLETQDGFKDAAVYMGFARN